MKPVTSIRNLIYPGLIVFCGIFAAVIFINGKTKTTVPALKERSGALAQAMEWAETRSTYAKLVTTLENKPDDARTLLQLAKTFMGEGRATGDFSYYNKAALDLIESVLKKDPKNFEGICLKSMVLLSQHRFSEGKSVAQQALAINPHNSFVYGLLVDANVELGDYAEAVNRCDNMVGIRPDIRSYSRVSYLRELHGQVPEAIDAIKQAVAAGVPGREDTEWARMVLAHLYEDTNQPELARQQYEVALQVRPGYPFALAGLGRISRFNKNYPAAIEYVQKAAAAMNDIAFYMELADLYRLNGQNEQADECYRITLAALNADNLSNRKDKNAGHNADFELANLYLKNNDPRAALEFARAEYDRRPQNLDACELYAWTLFLTGDKTEAARIMESAMRIPSQKPERLVRAGIILLENNQAAAGKDMIRKGLSLKPYMDESLASLANQYLNS